MSAAAAAGAMVLGLRLAAVAAVVLTVAWLSRRWPALAGLIAVMPLTGLLALLVVHDEVRGDPARMMTFARGAVWGILPTIGFFVVAWLCYRQRLPLWAVLGASFAAWGVGAALHRWLVR